MRRGILLILLLVVGILIIWMSATNSQNLIQKRLEGLFSTSSETYLISTKPSNLNRSEPTAQKLEPPSTNTSEPILKIETGFHSAIVNRLASTRTKQLLSVSDDKTARVWSSVNQSLKVLRVPIGPQTEGALYAVAASPTKDIIVVGGNTGLSWGNTGTVYSIDLNTGEIIGRLTGLSGSIHALSYSKDGNYLAIGTSTGVLRIINLQAKSLVTQNNDCSDTLTTIEYLSNNNVITACLDGSIRMYDANFQLIASYTLANKHRPWRIALSPDQRQAAIGSLDAQEIVLLSLNNLQPTHTFSPNQKKNGVFSSVAWSGNTLFGAGSYGEATGSKYIHFWNLKTGKQSDIAVSKDSITDLMPISDTELAYATAEALLGKVNLKNHEVVAQKRLIPDYRDAYLGNFGLSNNGTVLEIGKIQGGYEPVRFSFLDRTLTEKPEPATDLFPPKIPNQINNWRNSTVPTLNGKAIKLDENEYSRSVASSADGSLIALGCDYSLRLFSSVESLWKISLQSPAWAVNLSKDGRYVVAALGDGTVHWFKVNDAAEAMALFITVDNRWIAWTPEGYFDHSTEIAQLAQNNVISRGLRPVSTPPILASKFVGYHINQGHAATPKFILSEQIQHNFYRPDLVSLLFQNSPALPNSNTIKNAKKELSNHEPPLLKSIAWCDSKQCNDLNLAKSYMINVKVPEIKLRYEYASQGSGIGDIVVKRNGTAVATRGLRVSNASDKQFLHEQKILLETGDNPITLSAFDGNKALQSKENIKLIFHYEAPLESKPSLYILSIGINNYQNTKINKLVNAVNDAEGINSLLNNKQTRFKEVLPTLLTEEKATRKNIEDHLKRISSLVQPDDVVIIYIAGHGVVINGHYYFLPVDIKTTVNEDIQANALSDETLSDLISNFSTSRVAILIDSCYSGLLASSDLVVRRNQDITWTGALGQSTGRFVLAGSANDQEALDGKDGHGVFTSVLLDALNGKADLELRGNKDNRVDIVELSEYAKQYVPEVAKKIDPSHAQKATGFFMGSDFFELVEVK